MKLWILSEEECRNRTWTHSKAKFRARVDRSDFDGISKACSFFMACPYLAALYFFRILMAFLWLVKTSCLLLGSSVQLTGPRYLLTLTNRRMASSRVFHQKPRWWMWQRSCLLGIECSTGISIWDPTNSHKIRWEQGCQETWIILNMLWLADFIKSVCCTCCSQLHL